MTAEHQSNGLPAGSDPQSFRTTTERDDRVFPADLNHNPKPVSLPPGGCPLREAPVEEEVRCHLELSLLNRFRSAAEGFLRSNPAVADHEFDVKLNRYYRLRLRLPDGQTVGLVFALSEPDWRFDVHLPLRADLYLEAGRWSEIGSSSTAFGLDGWIDPAVDAQEGT